VITEEDIESVVAAGRGLSPAASSYLEEDFVMNLLETVLDYMLSSTSARTGGKTSERSTISMPYSLATRRIRRATQHSLSTFGATGSGRAPSSSGISLTTSAASPLWTARA
jgi:hypothetical protein